MQTMACSKCKKRQDIMEFHSGYFRDGRLSKWCNACRLKRSDERKKHPSAPKAPGYSRAYTLQRKYGLTPEGYEELLRAQGGGCGVCGRRDSGNAAHSYLVVDHDHTSNRVRGLLCDPCNKALGHLQDSEEILKMAIAYLRRSTGRK